MNAIVDALAPLGVGHVDMPATPERLWTACAPGAGRDLPFAGSGPGGGPRATGARAPIRNSGPLAE